MLDPMNGAQLLFPIEKLLLISKMKKSNYNRFLLTIPDNTYLELVHDNRSGSKLEIVIPVCNEEKRLCNILGYYNEFDIVFLDGGSNDRTIELAIQGGASIFRRIGEHRGENHFVYYTNVISKSGYCFYMMADELININDLKEAAGYLQCVDRTVIVVRKIEWLYGQSPKMRGCTPSQGMARGFQRGYAAFDPYSFHDSLHFQSNSDEVPKKILYNLDHLHLKSVKNEYGKFGRYLDFEISQMLLERVSLYRYIRRFLAPLILLIVWRVWFNKTSFPRKLFRIMELMIACQLALMCWLEQKYLPNSEKQLEEYSSKYFEGE